jgi:hypothetical protein
MESARCLHRLGQPGPAGEHAARVVSLRSPERARSRAFAQLLLASILLGRGRVDEACDIARGALTATRAVGSALVLREFEALKQRLMPYRRNTGVAAFLAELDLELRDRRCLLFTSDGRI